MQMFTNAQLRKSLGNKVAATAASSRAKRCARAGKRKEVAGRSGRGRHGVAGDAEGGASRAGLADAERGAPGPAATSPPNGAKTRACACAARVPGSPGSARGGDGHGARSFPGARAHTPAYPAEGCGRREKAASPPYSSTLPP